MHYLTKAESNPDALHLRKKGLCFASFLSRYPDNEVAPEVEEVACAE
jgi:hypothetical protein